MHTDTDIFLHPLRRLSEAGYARSCNEKCPTVLCACPPASHHISFTPNRATAGAALFLY